MNTKTFALNTFAIALAVVVAAGSLGCGGHDVDAAAAALFDQSRPDVRPVFDASHSEQIGLINLTHNLLWNYEHGFAQLADEQGNLKWGFAPRIPEDTAREILASERGRSSIQKTSQAIRVWYDYDRTGNYRCVHIDAYGVYVMHCYPA